jgi:hypothetical protein
MSNGIGYCQKEKKCYFIIISSDQAYLEKSSSHT